MLAEISAKRKLMKRAPRKTVKVVKMVGEDCKEIEEEENRVYDKDGALRDIYFESIEACNANKLKMAMIDKFYKAFESKPDVLGITKKQESLERKRVLAEKQKKEQVAKELEKQLNELETQLGSKYSAFSEEYIKPIMESKPEEIVELREELQGTGTDASLEELVSIAAPIIPDIDEPEEDVRIPYRPGVPSINFQEVIAIIRQEHEKTRKMLEEVRPHYVKTGKCIWKKPPEVPSAKRGYYTVYSAKRKSGKGCPPRIAKRRN